MPASPTLNVEILRSLLKGELVRQLARYGVAGMGVTLFSTSIYTLAAVALSVPPLTANTISYACGLAVGYAIHSRWSFTAERNAGEARMMARFFTASAIAFGINSFWVWLATGILGLSPLAPVPAMIFITPLISFALNRYWVFRAA